MSAMMHNVTKAVHDKGIYNSDRVLILVKFKGMIISITLMYYIKKNLII